MFAISSAASPDSDGCGRPNGETARRYAIKGMPSSVLIGPDGRVVRVHEGFRPEQRQALEAAIVAALPAAR